MEPESPTKEERIKETEIYEKSPVPIEDSNADTVEECCDPYFYTKREGFTSEIYKIEVENLPRVIGYAQIKKLLIKKMNLKPHKIKVIGKTPPMVFVTFRCQSDREQALSAITGFEWKGRKLFAKNANPMADPLVKKRKTDLDNESTQAKKPKGEDPQQLPVSVMLQNAVTPLWHLPYDDQLHCKQEQMKKFMKKLTHSLESINPLLFQRGENKSDDTLCCPLLPVIGSPTTCGYRNKCEFNVGLHPETGKPTVGFRISSYKEGSKCVADAQHCKNIPQIMVKAAQLFQDYILSSSKEVFNPENHEGYWRQLTVRTTQKEHLLLIVVMHPQSLTQEEIDEEKKKVKEHFVNSDLNVTSLYFQKFIKKEKVDPPMEHIYGSTFLEDELLGLSFRISPDAFFQVNTLGTELLYSTVAEFASLTKDTTVLDFCCGTGAIGISLAKKVSKVVGVELCQSAVENARHNAQANGIENAEFICGRVEDVIFNVLNKITEEENVVAIVDPPRAGLSNKVIKAMRGMAKLKRLVYLSCSPQNAITNFVDLCRPCSNNYRGDAFKPKKAVVMDLFPQTMHCELILLFER